MWLNYVEAWGVEDGFKCTIKKNGCEKSLKKNRKKIYKKVKKGEEKKPWLGGRKQRGGDRFLDAMEGICTRSLSPTPLPRLQIKTIILS